MDRYLFQDSYPKILGPSPPSPPKNILTYAEFAAGEASMVGCVSGAASNRALENSRLCKPNPKLKATTPPALALVALQGVCDACSHVTQDMPLRSHVTGFL